MQIKHATARGVGYSGSASGLIDAETNLTYAVHYLAGAYQAAGGNPSRAVALYPSGYHGRGWSARRAPRDCRGPGCSQHACRRMQAAPVAHARRRCGAGTARRSAPRAGIVRQHSCRQGESSLAPEPGVTPFP